MINPTEVKDPKIYTAYLLFLLLGMPIISILGMYGSAQPTALWSVIAIPLSLLFFLPILPRGYKNAMRKKELSPFWWLVIILLGISLISTFIYIALTRSLPVILMPALGTQFEKVMTIESITKGGRKVCVSGTRITIVDSTNQLRTTMCFSRNVRDQYKVGQNVVVKGYGSWFGFSFEEIRPFSESTLTTNKKSPSVYLQHNSSQYLGLDNIFGKN